MHNIKAVFIDRDGTLIEDKHYLSNPAGVVLLPHVGKALKILQEAGTRIFIVTNQSGIGRGYFSEQDFFACQEELYAQLEAFNVHITDMAFCPHSPPPHPLGNDKKISHKNACTCRKPETGMWLKLREKYHLTARECVMIGDKKEDIAFGVNAGFRTSYLVPTGKGLHTAQELAFSFDFTQNIEITTHVTTFYKNTPPKQTTKCVASPNFYSVVNDILHS